MAIGRDSDTIPDEVEKHPILSSYGYFVHSNPDNDDTDYDGLKDNEELGMNCYVMGQVKDMIPTVMFKITFRFIYGYLFRKP